VCVCVCVRACVREFACVTYLKVAKIVYIHSRAQNQGWCVSIFPFEQEDAGELHEGQEVLKGLAHK